MNKKFINGMLVASLMAGAAGSFTSCKDYDDDIDNLQNQINSVVTKVSEVQDLVKGGKIISNVTKTDNGIDITIDGTVYKITNGENGENGTAWTIGADGYWYENGQKTENKAIGSDGANGANGANGEYYVPQENGFFAIYKDGEKVKDTTISWKGETTVTGKGITAVYTGTKLTLSGVEGTTSDVVIDLGVNVGSIAFVPSVMSSAVAYPTTDDPFYNIATYFDETKYNADKTFKPQTFDKSNIVDLVYRVNPDNAFVAENANYSFINRAVTSRAAGDETKLLNVVAAKVVKGEINVTATINASAVAKTGENIAALSMWNGQANTISDYIQVETAPVTPILVDSIATTKTTTKPKTAVTKGIYNRTKAIVANGETDAFVKEFVPLTAADYATTLVYDSEFGVNLENIPGLFVADKGFLKELGFVGQSYKFSLPKEYRSNDTQKTNQQDFVTLDGTVLKINTAKLVANPETNKYPQAIGRTPVVRIDAFLNNNKGEAKLVASAYIKVQITEMSVSEEDKGEIPGTISPVKEYEYHDLTDKNTLVGQMPWMDVNNTIYGKTGLTAKNFWNYYGGEKNEYAVKISTMRNGKELVLDNNTAVPTGSAYVNNKVAGIEVETLLNSGETQTSNIKVDINEKVLTQNSYDNVNNKGAQYTVTVTIPSDNKKVLGDIVLTQVFYVKETCTAYKFNPLYWNADKKVAEVNGTAVNNQWVMDMKIAEVFEMIKGENIFGYFKNVNNAKDIDFSLEPSTQKGVAYDETNNVISLNAPLSTPTLTAGMKYVVTLDNKETCTFKFDVEFINPFIAGTAKAVSLNGNQIGGATTEAAPSVVVNQSVEPYAAVYAWDSAAKKLALTKAAASYYVAEPTVKYEFVKDKAFEAFDGQLNKEKTTFKIDETTGVVTFHNGGARLQNDHNLTVKATVTFDDLSVVTVNIPLTIAK